MADPVVIAAPKSLDARAYTKFRQDLHEAVSRHSHVVVDLEGVEFMDADGLTILVGAHRAARAHDTTLTVICTLEPVLRLFRVTTMDKLLDVRPTLEECYA
jgi:anti-sigma B factor antagonist